MASEEDGQDSNLFLSKLEADTMAIQTNNTAIYIGVNFMSAERGMAMMAQK